MASNLPSSSQRAGGQDLAGAQVAVAAEVEVREFDSSMPSSLATALRTLTPSAATSGPVPSPPITATLSLFLLTESFPMEREYRN